MAEHEHGNGIPARIARLEERQDENRRRLDEHKRWIDGHDDWAANELDKLAGDKDRIYGHIGATRDALEARIEVAKRDMDARYRELENRMDENVAAIRTTIKAWAIAGGLITAFLGVVGTIVGIVVAVKELRP